MHVQGEWKRGEGGPPTIAQLRESRRTGKREFNRKTDGHLRAFEESKGEGRRREG